MHVRRARAEDQAFIADLGGRSVEASASSLRPAGNAELVANFAALLTYALGRDHAILLAEREGRPSGFALLIFDLPDEVTGVPQAFLAYMAVEPAHRCLGTGRALLRAAEDEAIGRGLPYISLMVTEENEAGRRLYEGAGYATERRLLCKAL